MLGSRLLALTFGDLQKRGFQHRLWFTSQIIGDKRHLCTSLSQRVWGDFDGFATSSLESTICAKV
jgi:hypothetical protein